jgi:polar amino acid transport system substrate-binding protein
VALASSAFAQTKQSIWDKIQSSGVMVTGIIAASGAGSYKDLSTGTYKGYYVNFAQGIAEDLSKAMGRPIKLEFAETSWATVVMDLQAGRIDIWTGMSETPERLKALDMAGPMYVLAHCYVNRKGLEGLKTWEDYNKPEIKISVTIGTSDEAAVKQNSPKATFLGFKDTSTALLAVHSGRADAVATSVFTCLDMKKRNPDVGKIVFPEPVKSLPSSAGMRKDGDGRFHEFMKTWAAKNRASGATKKMIISALRDAGLNPDELPPDTPF